MQQAGTALDPVSLKTQLKRLYFGESKRSVAWRGFGLLVFDCSALLTFFAAFVLRDAGFGLANPWALSALYAVEVAVGLFMLCDFAARLWISGDGYRYLFRIWSLVDVAVIFAMLLPGAVNFGFLRIIRLVWFLRSLRRYGRIRFDQRQFSQGEQVFFDSLYLFCFIVVISEVVYWTQVAVNDTIGNYVDALYFTVSTLTTTGYGDVLLVGQDGRLLAVVIMVVGISLFLRLANALFTPRKVRFTCGTCGLTRHDGDADFCKHCGEPVALPRDVL